jgi:hypothetical protein
MGQARTRASQRRRDQTGGVNWIVELRDRWRHRFDDLVCQQAVELVTDYVENVMTSDERIRFERHLSTCAACTNYVEQVRSTAAALGHAQPEPPSAETRTALLEAFRDFKRG